MNSPARRLLGWWLLALLVAAGFAHLGRWQKDAEKVEIAPGPNNPVGTIWLGLTKPHWGIHGTPEPAKVGHSETNGCIHLTNWDAERLAKIVKVGAKVDVKA